MTKGKPTLKQNKSVGFFLFPEKGGFYKGFYLKYINRNIPEPVCLPQEPDHMSCSAQ